ncbi:MAG: autotransporter assembly complex protein TamA [Plesiomonas sp.]|uniref:autotransporter assembly complex protein TamA n=1 Tax=Plesiomonas sp. TaxID=2486279 RepID=UPI003F2FF66B
MQKRAVYLLLTLLFASLPLQASVKLQINGLSGELQRNVRAHLSTITDDEVSASPRFKRRVKTGIEDGLKALGYFNPEIQFDLVRREPPAKPLLVVKVNPGEPVKIKKITIELLGDAQNDPAFQALLKKTPKIGSVLNQSDFDSFRKQLTSLALERGYFKAQVSNSKLEVAPELHEAFWVITLNSGRRYRFGQVTFSGSQILESRLTSLIPFKPGDYYLAATLAKLNQNLSDTNWFRNVVIDPLFSKTSESIEVPLQVTVAPRAPNKVEFSLGYATDVGPRTNVTWNKPWINKLGHSSETKMGLSHLEQTLEFGYRVPTRDNPLEKFYTFNSKIDSKDNNDTLDRSISTSIGSYWNVSSGWQHTLTLNASYSSFKQGLQQADTFLLYPGVQFARTRSRGGLMPYWGDSQIFGIYYANTAWLSDIDMLQLRGRSTWIRTYANKHRFVSRFEAGWLESSDFDKVPPSLRFFAGGDRSIRGYRYESISPVDSNGKLTGASRMATGSFEYQYNVSGNWWGAVFYDTGFATNKFSHDELKSGVGVGVRWGSPLGPVRIDIAHPLAKGSSGVQFYISLGPEL